MNFSKWLHQELLKFNTSGKTSDFEIDYQELLYVIEGTFYPSYNFLVRLICYLDLEIEGLNVLVEAVSKDKALTSDEVYMEIINEMQKIQEENLKRTRNCGAV